MFFIHEAPVLFSLETIVNATTPVSTPTAQVLLVDDSAEELHLLTEMLRGEELQLSGASSVTAAYEHALNYQPDLIVLGARDEQDVLELENLLRNNLRTNDISVLFLIAYKHLSQHLVDARSATLDYLVKPFTVAQLDQRIRAQLKLSALLRADRRLRAFNTRATGDENWALIESAKEYLESRLADPVRLPDLAKALGVSERKLAASFQICVDMSLADYVRHERMRRAKQLLLHTTLSVGEVARQVGFSSAANFSTAFNNWVGATPSSFRSQALSNTAVFNRVLATP